MNRYLYVYMLRCSDKSYYVGITNNLERRVEEHNSAFNTSSYTSTRRPVELVYFEQYTDFTLAINREKQLKAWGRKKKEALIEMNWKKLHEESTCKNETTHKNYIRQ